MDTFLFLVISRETLAFLQPRLKTAHHSESLRKFKNINKLIKITLNSA